MKRTHAILVAVMLAGLASAQSVLDQVRQASAASGGEYVTLRNQLVSQGAAIEPELQTILAATNSPWQERLMAGICLDHIQKGAVIQELIQRDWRNDPELKDLPGWSSRMGEPQELPGVIRRYLEEAAVTHYCLELVWKQTGDRSRFSRRGWEGVAAAVAFDQKNPFAADVFVSRLRSNMDINSIPIEGYYLYLIGIGRSQDLPLLFDAWVGVHKKSVADYPAQKADVQERYGNVSFPPPSGGLDKLLALAKPEDATWIVEKLRDVPLYSTDKGAYEAFVARCDITPPVITLRGTNPVTIECGGVYADAGATATDDKDGDITARMEVENNVDTPKVGTYQVIYRVTDAAGNTATATRTVKVVYKFEGFLPPIGGADAMGGSFDKPLRTFKLGSTVPVKFKLGCGGAAVKTGVHTLQAIKYNNATIAAEPIDTTPTDAATTGNQFKLVGDEWHFNLDTKATGMSAGVWQLKVTLADGTTHTVWIALK